MPRQPPQQLSRRLILETAIDLMDRDGYAAFSLPRLGDELGIRTPSLYHHFRDRAELLAEVARTVVLETELPTRRPDAHWTEYFVDLSVNFRRTILRHANTAPVLLQFLPRDILTRLFEESAVGLAKTSDLPLSAHVLVMDGLERLAIGNALIESASPRGNGGHAFPNVDPAEQPQLTAAVAANTLNSEELFIESVRAFLLGVSTRYR